MAIHGDTQHLSLERVNLCQSVWYMLVVRSVTVYIFAPHGAGLDFFSRLKRNTLQQRENDTSSDCWSRNYWRCYCVAVKVLFATKFAHRCLGNVQTSRCP